LATRSLRVFFSNNKCLVWLLLWLSLHERKRETDVIAGVICYHVSG
jgi:hypothetical protein